MKNKILYTLVVLIGMGITLTSCSKELDIDPTEYATSDQIKDLGEKDPSKLLTIAEATIKGVYGEFIEYQGTHDVFGEKSVQLAGDLMTEDMSQMVNHYFFFDYEIDNRGATYRRVSKAWSFYYTVISKSNEAIASIDPETDDKGLQVVLGQALALRAYGLFMVVNRFQQTYKGNESKPGVPIYLTGNDKNESFLGRAPLQDVYAQVVDDLQRSITLLDGFARGAKTVVDKKVASGILAKVYMMMHDWDNAQKMANQAKSGYKLMTIEEARNDGFNNIANSEWMWGADVTSDNTTKFASFQSHMFSTAAGYAGAVGAYKAIDARLYSQIGDNDVRKTYFSDGSGSLPKYANTKYDDVAGWLADICFMRVSEMYLIEAEAFAQQNKTGEAANVLNELLENRITDYTPVATASVEDVFLQKRIECWGEGVIFYDYLRLKKGVDRTYEGSNHLAKIKKDAGSWSFIYQIPQVEIDTNSEISSSDQNPADS